MVRASPAKCRPALALLARRQDGMHNDVKLEGERDRDTQVHSSNAEARCRITSGVILCHHPIRTGGTTTEREGCSLLVHEAHHSTYKELLLSTWARVGVLQPPLFSQNSGANRHALQSIWNDHSWETLGGHNEDRKVSSCPPNFWEGSLCDLACLSGHYSRSRSLCDDQNSRMRLARQTLSIDLIIASSCPQVQRRLGKPTVTLGRHPSPEKILCAEGGRIQFRPRHVLYFSRWEEEEEGETGGRERLGSGRALMDSHGELASHDVCRTGFASIRPFSLFQACSPRLRSLV